MAAQVVTPAKSHNIMMMFNFLSAGLVGILPVLTSVMPVLHGFAPGIYGVMAALLPIANLIAHKSTQPVVDAAPITADTVVPPMTPDGAPVVELQPGQ